MTTPEQRAEWQQICNDTFGKSADFRRFNAAAREALPALLAENEKLRTDANNLFVSLQNETLEWQKSNGALIERVTAAEAERDRLRAASKSVLDNMFLTWRARNGRNVGVQSDDGEKCWIVHSDDIEALRAALEQKP
jgi:hypothetical protein